MMAALGPLAVWGGDRLVVLVHPDAPLASQAPQAPRIGPLALPLP
jgi:hypothetical protein